MVSELEVGMGLFGSDHALVSFEILEQAHSERISSRRKLNLRRANYGRFTAELQAAVMQPHPTAETQWSELKTTYLEIQSRNIPMKRIGG